MIFTVKAIMSPYVFIDNPEGIMNRIRLSDIIEHQKVRLMDVLEKKDNGKYIIVGKQVDSDCVGGVCPIK
ncbi:MAG: hypothetical protein K9L62_02125 [Vallitaleaceae bacterium]|nr:hypothetical protein [Vallitaleaceae bacterium]